MNLGVERPTGDAMPQGSGNVRKMRTRVKVNYFEPTEEEHHAAKKVPYKELVRRICQDDFASPESFLHPRSLTVEKLVTEGFQQPLWVRSLKDRSATLQELGMALPLDFSAQQVAEAVGCEEKLRTIDVMTQQPGPRLSLREWLVYFHTPPEKRTRLLNVVSLPLSGTPLQETIVAPTAVREVDLVNKVWPPNVHPKPEVLLYALMSPAEAFTDFHIDFGGSSVWYHVVYGRKVFLMVPPTPANWDAYQQWASSEMQATSFFADNAEGCIRYELGPGETLLIPSGWAHAVVTPTDSLVVGGNFLHGYDLRKQVEVSLMEEQLGVPQSARFPLYRPLMWHAAAHYVSALTGEAYGGGAVLTEAERQGLPALVLALRQWLSTGKGSSAGVPETLENPDGLLNRLCHLLGMPESFEGSPAKSPTLQNAKPQQEQIQIGGTKDSYEEDSVWEPFDTQTLEGFEYSDIQGMEPEEIPAFSREGMRGLQEDAHIRAKAIPGALRGQALAKAVEQHAPPLVATQQGRKASEKEVSISGDSDSSDSDIDWGDAKKGARRKGGKGRAGVEADTKKVSARRKAMKKKLTAQVKPMKRSTTAAAMEAPVVPVEAPKDLVPLKKSTLQKAGMGMKMRLQSPTNKRPASQLRSQAMMKLQRLEAELRKERELQDRLASSQLPLKDGGAKIAARIASLTSGIAAAKAAIPVSAPGMRGEESSAPSLMIPVAEYEAQRDQGEEEVKVGRLADSQPSHGPSPPGKHLQRKRRALDSGHPPDQAPRRPRTSLQHGRQMASLKEQQAQKEAAEKLQRQREREAAEWEDRRKLWAFKSMADEAVMSHPEAYEGVWSCLTTQGEEREGCQVSELCEMLLRGEILENTKVHDEEDGVTLRLSTLLQQPQNQARLAAAKLAHRWQQKSATVPPSAPAAGRVAESMQYQVPANAVSRMAGDSSQDGFTIVKTSAASVQAQQGNQNNENRRLEGAGIGANRKSFREGNQAKPVENSLESVDMGKQESSPQKRWSQKPVDQRDQLESASANGDHRSCPQRTPTWEQNGHYLVPYSPGTDHLSIAVEENPPIPQHSPQPPSPMVPQQPPRPDPAEVQSEAPELPQQPPSPGFPQPAEEVRTQLGAPHGNRQLSSSHEDPGEPPPPPLPPGVATDTTNHQWEIPRPPDLVHDSNQAERAMAPSFLLARPSSDEDQLDMEVDEEAPRQQASHKTSPRHHHMDASGDWRGGSGAQQAPAFVSAAAAAASVHTNGGSAVWAASQQLPAESMGQDPGKDRSREGLPALDGVITFDSLQMILAAVNNPRPVPASHREQSLGGQQHGSLHALPGGQQPSSHHLVAEQNRASWQTSDHQQPPGQGFPLNGWQGGAPAGQMDLRTSRGEFLPSQQWQMTPQAQSAPGFGHQGLGGDLERDGFLQFQPRELNTLAAGGRSVHLHPTRGQMWEQPLPGPNDFRGRQPEATAMGGYPPDRLQPVGSGHGGFEVRNGHSVIPSPETFLGAPQGLAQEYMSHAATGQQRWGDQAQSVDSSRPVFMQGTFL